MTFENGDSVLAAAGGDALALRALGVFLEPGVNVSGAHAVFSRTSQGWTVTPIATPAMVGEEVLMELFSPDLSQIGFSAAKSLSGTGGTFERGSRTFEMGPVGGPYTTVATVPESYAGKTRFVGVNNGVEGRVPAFSTLVFVSADHALLPPGPEREAAEETEPGRPDLYMWADGQLRLVNVDSDGRLLNRCGAGLGHGQTSIPGVALNAVSADGSRVLFTSPQESVPGCPEPALYMRVEGRETVDVSEPQGVNVAPAERAKVLYVGASADGSKVFFATDTALTPAGRVMAGPYLYEYDTEAPAGSRLKLIANEVPVGAEQLNPTYLVSEDGSAVYYMGVCNVETNRQHIDAHGICRYEAATGKRTFVAVRRETAGEARPSFVTSNGEFYLFQSGSSNAPQPVEFLGPHGLEQELRGSGNQQLYRYDAADGSVMCVSCGEGAGPVVGFTDQPTAFDILFNFPDLAATALAMSEDGRRVFFQTTAKLVSQDGNGSASEAQEQRLGPGTDVYEWEQDGTEEAPGVFCGAVYGCTHLISAGEDVGPERFLGASANGRDVFFASAAQMLPQATPEFDNIYDARVDGGFPPPPPSAVCMSCQGVGSPPPTFSSSASETFTGGGNSALVSALATVSPGPRPKVRRCGAGRVRHDSRCVKPRGRAHGRGRRRR